MKPTLNYPFRGYAYRAFPAEWKQDGFERSPELEEITGAFRVVDRDGDDLILGNGEARESYWLVPWSEVESWEDAGDWR